MAPSPLGRWKVSFEVVLGSGKSKSAPGFLLLWPRGWLVLVNHKDSPIVGKHLTKGEVFILDPKLVFSRMWLLLRLVCFHLLVSLPSLRHHQSDGG
jgi:hypothetical protein